LMLPVVSQKYSIVIKTHLSHNFWDNMYILPHKPEFFNMPLRTKRSFYANT
jgi:hypothetical protein